ncbi:hypothetical protein RYX36_026155 [Vicia faba]
MSHSFTRSQSHRPDLINLESDPNPGDAIKKTRMNEEGMKIGGMKADEDAGGFLFREIEEKIFW